MCELLMPLVIKTDMYRRWERLPRSPTTPLNEPADGDESKRQEERLLREVLAEGQPMTQWSSEQKEAMIRYTLQLQARANPAGESAGGTVRLGELMEACMSMYQSLLKAQQQSVTHSLPM